MGVTAGTGRAPASRAVHGDLVYAIGGQFHEQEGCTNQKLVEAYDPKTNKWTRMASAVLPRRPLQPARSTITLHWSSGRRRRQHKKGARAKAKAGRENKHLMMEGGLTVETNRCSCSSAFACTCAGGPAHRHRPHQPLDAVHKIWHRHRRGRDKQRRLRTAGYRLLHAPRRCLNTHGAHSAHCGGLVAHTELLASPSAPFSTNSTSPTARTPLTRPPVLAMMGKSWPCRQAPDADDVLQPG